MRAQLGFLRSQPAAPQFPSHLMSSQLGFCAEVLPHNPETGGKSRILTEHARRGTRCSSPGG